MRMYDIIMKKREGKELLESEINFFIDEYVKGAVPDYQVAALLMAIYFKGMTDKETTALTMSMASSGEIVDLSAIEGIKIDKHSTGGVGDKTTLIISPIVASLGVKVAKMSGRGLGHTGGTIDKLESIPGFKTDLNREKFFEIVKNVGVSIIGQSGNLVPADKKLYALRDVTATIDSIPLIASSVMSKKIAAGSDCILLDVKAGSGAFMKTVDQAIELSKIMVRIGERVGKKTIALITDMDKPLGRAIGNSLEVIEACETLKGRGPKDLTELCLDLSANMLYLAGKGSLNDCRNLAKTSITNGSAFAKLQNMVFEQGGDVEVLQDYAKFKSAKYAYEVKAEKTGYVSRINTESCGKVAVILGAGRETKESSIDMSAGIYLNKKFGDQVKTGETIAILYSDNFEKCKIAEKSFLKSISISKEEPINHKTVFARVTIDEVEKY